MNDSNAKLTKYFIKHVTTYSKFTKTAKGQKVLELVSGLENILLNSSVAVVQLQESLSHQVHKLNCRFPRTSRWIVTLSHFTHISIRPEQNGKNFDDYIASIIICRVNQECDAEGIHRLIKNAIKEEGGEK